MHIRNDVGSDDGLARLALEPDDIGTWLVNLAPTPGCGANTVRWSDHSYRVLDMLPQFAAPSLESFTSVFHPDDRHRAADVMHRAIEHKGRFQFECRAHSAHSGERILRVRGRVMRDAKGMVARLGGTWADVTEQAAAEQRQRAMHARFQAMFEQSAVGIAIASFDGRFLQVNSSFAGFLGFAPEDLCNRSVFDVTHPEHIDSTRTFAGQFAGCALPATYERRFLRSDGAVVWARVTLSRLQLEPGEAECGFLGIFEDITEQRATHAALARQTEMMRGMLEHLPVMVARFSPVGKCTYANRECERVFGWTGESAPEDIVAAAFPDPSECARVRTLLANPDGKWQDLEPTGASGRRVPSSWACITQSGGERLMIGQDLRERRTMQERLAHSQKMEALGQLAGGVAHDFNNMLTIMSASAAFIETNASGTSDIVADAREIQAVCQRAASLTRRLLAFSRRQILQMEVVDINEALGTLSKSINRVIGENIQLALELKAERAHIEVDRHQLEQVVLNLVVNARDAIKDHGTITISTRNATGPRGTPQVVTAVRDDGCGIDPAIRHRIFEPFFTTKGVGKGTGIGLATVLGVVEQSGGSIEVHNGALGGTVFEVSLPTVAAVACAPRTADALAETVHHETVLLVEDEASVRAVVHRMLTGLGYSVVVARHGADALQLFRQQAVDIVVTDVVMPEMGGRELTNRLREIRAQLPVLFISGYTDDELLRKGILEPGVRLLRKPFTERDLATAVHGLLTGAASSAAPPAETAA